jgi:lysophospholipase L1-like esterase
VFGIGDSITAHGYTASGTFPYGKLDSQAYLIWAALLSQGRVRFAGVAATSGYTAASILSTHLPTAITAAPAACVVLAGTNDVQGIGTGSNGYDSTAATTMAQYITTMTSIYTRLLQAGSSRLPARCRRGRPTRPRR